MPPKKAPASPASLPVQISCGGGMTAGLEIWRVGPRLYLYDRSPDARFATDVTTWNTATGGLNTKTLKHIKDAVDAISTAS